jgi:hypothetical protein
MAHACLAKLACTFAVQEFPDRAKVWIRECEASDTVSTIQIAIVHKNDIELQFVRFIGERIAMRLLYQPAS